MGLRRFVGAFNGNGVGVGFGVVGVLSRRVGGRRGDDGADGMVAKGIVVVTGEGAGTAGASTGLG